MAGRRRAPARARRRPPRSTPVWLPMIAVGAALAAVGGSVLHPRAERVPGAMAIPLAAGADRPASPGTAPEPRVSGPLDPARFAPGSCTAFPPTAGDRHQTVFLDPGHGGPDSGGIARTDAGQDVSEKQFSLPVAVEAANALRANGFRVVLSRTADSTVSRVADEDLLDGTLSTVADHRELLARIQCANLAGAAALVSIHFDAYDDATAQGMTTLYDQERPFAQRSLALATALQQEVLAALAAGGRETTDRGVLDDTTSGGGELTDQGTSYGHLDVLGPTAPGYLEEASAMPGALIEPLFITNPADEAIAASRAGQRAIGQGIGHAVQRFLRP